ncbi:MAG: flap endonuclease-1 [Thermoplasmatales archaeon]|nr:flap endonuclease-1 [Candidatus Thermoplasmatota archaeon]MDA8054466.1 flap endonuclease-1 [Thermoplasmatales archaeon]
MGVDISSLLESSEVDLKNLKGRLLAVDAFNVIYQFLSNIREYDGSPLKDKHGMITSHLSGLFYRNISMLETGIVPVYVFDGKPPALKAKTIKERIALKEKAEEEYRLSLAMGDYERAKSFASRTSRLTSEMISESKDLLNSIGIAVVDAPSEGEAEASFLCRIGSVYSAVSQDYDSLLFGSPRLIRNLTISGKRRYGRTGRVVDVKPEMIVNDEILRKLGITREQLIDMGILIGTDFNDGIKGIGPKKAYQLIKKNGSLKNISNIKIENYDEIRDIFLNPEVVDPGHIKVPELNEQKAIDILVTNHDFSQERVSSALSRVRESRKQGVQRSIDSFF